jgi:hypothetical protein
MHRSPCTGTCCARACSGPYRSPCTCSCRARARSGPYRSLCQGIFLHRKVHRPPNNVSHALFLVCQLTPYAENPGGSKLCSIPSPRRSDHGALGRNPLQWQWLSGTKCRFATTRITLGSLLWQPVCTCSEVLSAPLRQNCTHHIAMRNRMGGEAIAAASRREAE